jgi:hypothetical protein
MRLSSIGLVALALIGAACGGGTAATSTPAGPGATAGGPAAATPAAATPAGATAQPPAGGGGEAVRVVITGGPNAGTYTAAGETNCSNGLIGPQGWGVQFSVATATAGQLSSVQMVVAAKGKENDPNATFGGTAFLMTVTIGPLFEGTNFEVAVKTDADESKGSGSADVQDNGSTAVIHATGTTPEGVGIDATVNCGSVIRM